MEIEKEGLYTYRVSASVQNEYFLSVEYQIIRYNQPDTLLPMLIREQDGTVKLLYELSDVKSLAEISEENNSHGNNFSKEDCRLLLQSLHRLLEELEELLLSPEHINFSPECIYRTGENSFRWMYCPDETYDMEKEVQQFFSWMLSEINYGDSEAVRYIYHVYWMMRNKKFSEKLIEECLNYDEDVPQNVPYESFFAEEIAQERMAPKDIDMQGRQDKQGSQETAQDWKNQIVWNGAESWKSQENAATHRTGKTESEVTKGRQDKRLLIAVEVMLGIAAAVTGVIVAASGVYSLWNGVVPLYNRYWLAGILLLILLAQGVWQMHRRRRAPQATGERQKGRESQSTRESQATRAAGASRQDKREIGGMPVSDRAACFGGPVSDGEMHHEKDISRSGVCYRRDIPGSGTSFGEQSAESVPFFQEGDGTVRLDMGMRKKQPVLKEEATGEVFPVQSYPFYIGNDKGLNQLTIYDNTVSRKHAVIERGNVAGIYILKDLQSTNGTWVNHTRIENDQIQLKDGDVLRFAGHTYRFEITDGFV